MRKYELVIVLDGKATAAKKKAVSEKLEKLTESIKGKLGKAKDWGVKDLSYKLKKSTTGVFLIFPLELDGPSVKEMTNNLRLQEDVIRYLLVRKEN